MYILRGAAWRPCSYLRLRSFTKLLYKAGVGVDALAVAVVSVAVDAAR